MKTKNTTNDGSRNQNSDAHREGAEQWWAKLSPVQRMLARQIAAMMTELSETKRIEIRKELDKVRVRFIHILKQPEEGCLSAIVLPEVSRLSWN